MKSTTTRLFTAILAFVFALTAFSNIQASSSEGQNSKSKFPASYFLKKGMAGNTIAKVYGIDKTVNIKFTNPQDNTKTISTSAGTFKGDVDGSAGSFYCIDLFHYVQWYTTQNPHTYTDDGNTSAQVTYILNSYYPFKEYPYSNCASSVQIEAAAVQVALWHFVDNADANTVDNISVKTRALQIINDTENNYTSLYPFETLLIVPADQTIPYGTDASFFVSALDANGDPLSGISVTLSASNGILTTTTVTTGADGNTPVVKLSQGAGLNSTITASASVKVSPGTKYVHTIDPNNYQKLVLATPCGITKKITADVTWYIPAGCDTKGFTTFTQGGWGNKNGTPGKIRDTYFSSVFPNGLIIGSTYKLTLTTASKVKDFLPAGGTSGKFTQNYTNASSTSAGVFAGQLVALKLNIEFDAAGKIGSNTTNFGDLQIATGTFSGKTVNQFFALAETAIGGGSLNGYTYSQFNDAATAINENFDNGTTDKGFLTCGSVDVKASLGDKVWLDTNKNGVQDSGENGVANVSVKLYDCSDNLISTKVTDSNGNYLFDNLNPGDYYVLFGLPTGYVFTTKDSGADDNKDSDADLSTGKTICTTLTAGENDFSWDAGIYQEACKNKVGDFVWRDLNVNGIQDSGEPGIPNVAVELIQNNSTIATTTTDVDGKYEFSNLVNGTYSVRVAASNYIAGGTLYSSDKTKWYTTSKNLGNNDLKDSDANKNESVTVTLNCGDNITVDFGFYKTCITVTKSANKQTAKPGDKITYSFTVENCGDIQFHGGIDIFDKLLNKKSPYNIKHIDILNSGESTTFTADYTVVSADCGNLINEVTAEGHPVNGSAYVSDIATTTVVVDCGPTCTTDWTISIDNDQEVCESQPKEFTVNGSVSITPKPSSGYLVTSWNVAYPNDGSVDNSTKSDTVEITNDQSFQIKVQWPGIRSTDQLVEVHYSVLVLDCNKNALGSEHSGKISWNPTVCPPPPSNDADLKIEKSSSTQNPNCGDNITYTIKVTDLGPGNAKAVQVTDLLPAGVEYVSNTASQGSYNVSSGLWTVGDLAKDAFATLTITVKSNCDQLDNSVFDLGIAKDYNLFVLQDLTQPSSDTEGKVAVGRDAILGAYSVGDKLPANSGDVLVVGRDLTYTSGRVYNGDVAYGNSTNLPINQTSVDGNIHQDNPINFASAKTYLENLSVTLGGYAANGTSTYQWSTLTLTGNDPHLNVFEVSGSDLGAATSLEINAPNGSAVLVNINGTGMDWNGGLEVYGTTINNVLYNFYQAADIRISNIDVRGTILAPFADVNFASGVQNGQMICKSLIGMGQFNNSLFYGNIPANKTVTNIASITGSLSTDTDPNNNSASTTIVINSTNQTPGGGNPGGGSTGGTWQEVGSFAPGEIVYCMAFDANNNTYSGTMGGKIYESNDGGKTWSRINAGMNVGWIWSLVFHNNILFVATEAGVFKYEGSSWTLTTLKNIDVRAIVSFGNLLVAGTWGSGVYSSADNGGTWSEMNTELTNKAIQALTVDKNGNLFAGTAGSGVFKMFSGESRWYQYNVGNNIVWALSSSNGAVFASSYGGGLFVSTDQGSNWVKSALGQNYIYSIVTDNNNKVYVSSWTSGVFVTVDEGSSWNPLGMGGFGVSSIVASPSKDDLYAGTREGKIYKISFITGVEENIIPTEYKLEQNYPNPFNPSTTIEFDLPKSGKYSLKIYDILGREVSTLVNKEFNAGIHRVTFDASKYASGVYIYRLTGANINLVKKMVFIK